MKKAIFLAMILAVAMGLIALDAYAQEAKLPQAPAAPAAAPAEGQEAYGEAVSVDANAGKIEITEYDYEKDEDINKAYQIDKAATYENVKSLAEVKVGDWVALTLKPQKDGTSLAVSVYVEKYDIPEEEAAPIAPVAPAVTPATPAAQPATIEFPEEEDIK